MLSSGPGLPHVQSVRESRFQNPGNLCLLDPESWTLESGIRLKESRKPLMIEIQNPSSTDKNWNLANGTWNPRHGIQNPRLSSLNSLYTWETQKLHILAENNFFNFVEKNESVVHVFVC